MEAKELFSIRLKELLKEKKISQRELAKKANLSDAYISQLLMVKKPYNKSFEIDCRCS
jgi:transcriptional regulator with XRE-family HTH domain